MTTKKLTKKQIAAAEAAKNDIKVLPVEDSKKTAQRGEGYKVEIRAEDKDVAINPPTNIPRKNVRIEFIRIMGKHGLRRDHGVLVCGHEVANYTNNDGDLLFREVYHNLSEADAVRRVLRKLASKGYDLWEIVGNKTNLDHIRQLSTEATINGKATS